MSYLRRDSALNWLALGLLLAAWNTADDTAPEAPSEGDMPPRPTALRGYTWVSVRALRRMVNEMTPAHAAVVNQKSSPL